MTQVRPGQIFTFAQAVEVTGKSRSTLHRKRDMLRQAGAHQDADGVWRIPVSALVACGLLDTPTTPAGGVNDTRVIPPNDTPVTPPGETPQHQHLEQLRRALAEAEKRAEVAEAKAAERDRLIDAQSRTIALLEAHQPAVPEYAAAQSLEDDTAPAVPAPSVAHERPTETAQQLAPAPVGLLHSARRLWRAVR